jgi:CRISPR-associated protein Cmr3
MSEARTWLFEPDDTWFFREARPHGAVGASLLESRFPPPARTVAGAARSLMGETAGVDWQAFADRDGSAHRLEGVDLIEQIGCGSDPGSFRLTGPWVVKDGEPLFPAPAFLLQKGDALARLRLGAPVATDLGTVRLPEMDAGPGFKPLEDAWLTADGLAVVLAGQLPEPSQVRREADLFQPENRLGIARSNATRTASEGMLYQTKHLRPQNGVGVAVAIEGVDSCLHPDSSRIRFGGEGRMADVTVQKGALEVPAPPQSADQAVGVLLTLLTDADLEGDWLPSHFSADHKDGAKVWRGEIAGVGLTIHGAALAKVRREGGWDLVERRPREVRSLTPAGSTWFVEPDCPVPEALAALHGARIGGETALGRGHLAACVWPEPESPNLPD